MTKFLAAFAVAVMVSSCAVGTRGLSIDTTPDWSKVVSIDLDLFEYDRQGECESFRTLGINVGLFADLPDNPCVGYRAARTIILMKEANMIDAETAALRMETLQSEVVFAVAAVERVLAAELDVAKIKAELAEYVPHQHTTEHLHNGGAGRTSILGNMPAGVAQDERCPAGYACVRLSPK